MRCFTVLGPSQSGKTTLIDRLAALEGDTPTQETLAPLTLSRFAFLGDAWCAIDLPGGAEYAAMASGALMASDAAVICVPPDPESAMLCAPYLRAVEDAGVPAILFINRMDTATTRLRDIVAALQEYSNHSIVLRQIPMRDGDRVVGMVDLISERAWHFRPGQGSTLVELPQGPVAERESEAREELLETMSEFDDSLLEELVEDRVPATGALFDIASRELARNQVMPTFMGAAEHRNGMLRLMKALRHETPGAKAVRARWGNDSDLLAVTLHAQTRKHLGKVVALRALAPGVVVSDRLGGGNLGGLVTLGGGAVRALAEGEIALAVKSDQLEPARAVTVDSHLPRPGWTALPPPTLARVLLPASERDEVRLSGALARLAETDTKLALETEDETGHPLIRTLGPQHLRRVLAALTEDFAVTVEARAPQTSYREAISRPVEMHHRHRKQTGGAGQFADVVLTVAPRARGAGFEFSDTVKGGAVPRNYIPSVAAGAEDAMQRGPLGFPVIDVGVTLTDGKHHAVDSSDHAFRTAGRMGVKTALAQAGPILLQPICRVDIHVPGVFSGGLVAVVSALKGQVLGFERDPDSRGWDVFRASLPESALDALLQALAGSTQGTAWIESRFDHYEELYGREADEIARARLESTG